MRKSLVGLPDPTRPDVLCITVSSRTVGVELTKWVDREQLEDRKPGKSDTHASLRIVASEQEPRPDNIGWVWLYDKHRRVKPKDEAQFHQRKSFMRSIAEQTALADQDWDEPAGSTCQGLHTLSGGGEVPRFNLDSPTIPAAKPGAGW